MSWLPDMDLNHDKQIQSLLCYRYTIGQAGALVKLENFVSESSYQRRTGVSPIRNFFFNQRQAGSFSNN